MKTKTLEAQLWERGWKNVKSVDDGFNADFDEGRVKMHFENCDGSVKAWYDLDKNTNAPDKIYTFRKGYIPSPDEACRYIDDFDFSVNSTQAQPSKLPNRMSLFDIWQDGGDPSFPLTVGDFMGAVVCAGSLDDARQIHPNAFFVEYRWDVEANAWTMLNQFGDWVEISKLDRWPAPEKVHVKYLGMAKKGLLRGVVRTSCVLGHF